MRYASQKLLAASQILRAMGCAIALATLFCSSVCTNAADPSDGSSSRAAKKDAIRSVPFNRMNARTSGQVREVLDHPSYYRRMPRQQVECDPQMFTFLVRRPEVMVNIWQIMGITQVSAKRLNPYSFIANDGVGTSCRCDLIYADNNTHIYFGNGSYDGSMAPRKVTGSCVCILRSSSAANASGKSIVNGTMDVFLKLDSFGADLIARSVGPFVGKTADYNFVETAKFISQISQVCERSPTGAHNLAMNLDSVDSNVRREFAAIAANIGRPNTASPQVRDMSRSYRHPSSPVVTNIQSDAYAAYQSYAEQSRRGRTSSSDQGTAEVLHLSDTPGADSSRYGYQPVNEIAPVIRTRNSQHLPTLHQPDRRNEGLDVQPSGSIQTQNWQRADNQPEVDIHKRSKMVAPQKQNIFMRR